MKGTVLEISWHEKEPVLSVHCSAKRFATAGADNDVKLWSMPVREEANCSKIFFISSLSCHKATVNVVRFSPCENFISSGSDDGTIIIWKQNQELSPKDVESGHLEGWQVLHVLRMHRGDVYDLCWSPCGKFIVSASIDNVAVVWDAFKAKPLQQLMEHRHYVQGITWDPLNNFIASQSSDRTCRIYKVKEKGHGTVSCKFSFNIDFLTLQLDEDTVVKKRLFADETLNTFFRRLEFSPDGRLLLTPAGLKEKEYCVYGFARQNLSRPVICFPGLEKPAVAVRFCPVKFNRLPLKGAPLFDLPYRHVFSVVTLNSVLLYDTQHSHPFAALANLHYASLTDASWSPDGSMLFVSSRDGYCSIINFDSGELGEIYSEELALHR
ncbi:uncharacterized protein LOC135144135 isoform X2 [Zophobas morio]|uniref:uncharacterized protein LOC135144135 isoform X2 n=1 Tax=Zophobas morio TaxID=2755281 RepID=UPI003082B606